MKTTHRIAEEFRNYPKLYTIVYLLMVFWATCFAITFPMIFGGTVALLVVLFPFFKWYGKQ